MRVGEVPVDARGREGGQVDVDLAGGMGAVDDHGDAAAGEQARDRCGRLDDAGHADHMGEDGHPHRRVRIKQCAQRRQPRRLVRDHGERHVERDNLDAVLVGQPLQDVLLHRVVVAEDQELFPT